MTAQNRTNKNILIIFFSSIFLYTLIITAWIGDDAGITIRTVLNFINGYGLKFNIDERVQAFTHPLWLIIISFFSLFFENIFNVVFSISITLSLFTFIIIQAKALTVQNLTLVSLCMIFSIAFVDFSTSGLENALSHFLLVIIFYLSAKIYQKGSNKNICILLILSSLLYLNRPDLILLVLPLVIYMLYVNKINFKNLHLILIGLMPIIIWFIFSISYYGYLFPNTAYAKLGAGVSTSSKLIQGLNYFTHQLSYDLLTILIIIIGIVFGLLNNFGRLISLGIILYLIYILYIGGDFMEGRFFTAPFILSILIISQIKLNNSFYFISLLIILILGILGINRTIFSYLDYFDDRISKHGIASERGFYYKTQGLLTGNFKNYSSKNWIIIERNVNVTCGRLGFKGIEGGPGTHIIDTCALADPLLSRLPAINGPLRIGHFIRALPNGYVESISNNENLIINEKIKSLYEMIYTVTRSDLLSTDRLKAILILNTKSYELPSRDYFSNIINFNEKLTFKNNSKGQTFLKDGLKSDVNNNGWAMPENWGVWSLGNIARLSMPVPFSNEPTTLELEMQYVLSKYNSPLNFDLYIHNGNSNDGDYSRYNDGEYSLVDKFSFSTVEQLEIFQDLILIKIDSKIIKEGYVNLEFRIHNPFRLKDFVILNNSDNRLLSIGIKSAVFLNESN